MPLIILLGLVLRLTYIIKSEGLWNDEYVSWMIANTTFFDGFFTGILKQCHMPLYYLYLKPFSYFSDLILRLSSVIPGVLAIPVMYLAGKEYSKKTGYFAALTTSVLSFAIYYSQEVRFYSLLFLLSALLLLFTIRAIKEPSKKNLILFNILSITVIFTHVLGFIFVFFNYLYFSYKQKLFSKCTRKQFITGFLLTVSILLVFYYLGSNIIWQKSFSQWWGTFGYTNILFLFSDFLSPILTNNINAQPVFFYNQGINFWISVPTVIAIICMIFGIKQNKGFTLVSALTVIVLALLAKSGFIVFITKYAIEVLPIFIILLVCGAVKLKKAGLILFIFYISLHLASFFSPYYVTKIYRHEGNKIVGEILNKRKPQNAIFTYYAPNRFLRYTDLQGVKTYDISKTYRFMYAENPEQILNQLPKGETVSLIILNTVSFYNENDLTNNKDIPEMFRTYSHIKNKLYDGIENRGYEILSYDNIGGWTVLTFITK